MNTSIPSEQRGNVLFLLLLAVVLFAALSYAVTSSLRGGGQDSSSEKNDLIAANVLNYATLLEQTVTRLKLVNNCDDTQISFANNVSTLTYTNANAPANYSCHVFRSEGGGITYQVASAPPGYPVSYWQTEYSFYGANDIAGTATTAGDLVFYTPVTQKVCLAIQTKLGFSSIPSTNWQGSPFTGTYSNAGTISNNSITNYCFQYAANPWYYYRHVLISR